MKNMMRLATLVGLAAAFSACAAGTLCKAERNVEHSEKVCPPTFDKEAGQWVDQSLTPTGCTTKSYYDEHGGGE